MNRILGKETLKGAEKRLATACKSLVKKSEELSSEDVVNAISIVESKNGKKRLTKLLKFKDVSYSFNMFMSISCNSFLIHNLFIFTLLDYHDDNL